MKNVKMSLGNIQGKFSRAELRSIMAGSGYGGGTCACLGNDTRLSCTNGTIHCKGSGGLTYYLNCQRGAVC